MTDRDLLRDLREAYTLRSVLVRDVGKLEYVKSRVALRKKTGELYAIRVYSRHSRKWSGSFSYW